MERFKYLDHTSEAKFQAFGETLEEAFANAGLALINIMANVDEIKPLIKKSIEIKSKNLDSLLYDFLNELVFLKDSETLLISKFENFKISENKLTADAFGDKAKNYETGSDVKSPTYDEMEIKETNGWLIQAVVDV